MQRLLKHFLHETVQEGTHKQMNGLTELCTLAGTTRGEQRTLTAFMALFTVDMVTTEVHLRASFMTHGEGGTQTSMIHSASSDNFKCNARTGDSELRHSLHDLRHERSEHVRLEASAP